MIIASDLDRTLIYSNRAIDEFVRPKESILIPVESRQGKWVSFMTKESYIKLEAICREYLFVPITTRTIEQYERIFIFKQEFLPRYAITTNGAHILLDGEKMAEWSNLLSAKIRNETAEIGEIIAFLQKQANLFDIRIKQIEDLFFYFILNKPLAKGDKQLLSRIMAPFGWRVSLQGRKLFFIPKVINKGEALKFVCSHSGLRALAGAGDSILDLDFLIRCRNSYIPKHGELVQDSAHEIPKGISITKNCGVLAGEEILSQFLLF